MNNMFTVSLDNLGEITYKINVPEDVVAIINVLDEQYSIIGDCSDINGNITAASVMSKFEDVMAFITANLLRNQTIEFLPKFGDDCPLTIVEQKIYDDYEFDFRHQDDNYDCFMKIIEIMQKQK